MQFWIFLHLLYFIVISIRFSHYHYSAKTSGSIQTFPLSVRLDGCEFILSFNQIINKISVCEKSALGGNAESRMRLLISQSTLSSHIDHPSSKNTYRPSKMDVQGTWVHSDVCHSLVSISSFIQ